MTASTAAHTAASSTKPARRLLLLKKVAAVLSLSVALSAAGAVVLLGAAAVLQQARRRGRDQQYLGLTPGLTPTGAAAGSALRGGSRQAPWQSSPASQRRPSAPGRPCPATDARSSDVVTTSAAAPCAAA